MSRDTIVIAFRQREAIDDPLSELAISKCGVGILNELYGGSGRVIRDSARCGSPKHCQAADSSGLRYPSNLTHPAWHGGCKRSVNVPEVLNWIFNGLWAKCQRKALPKDLSPKSTMLPTIFPTSLARTTTVRLHLLPVTASTTKISLPKL